MSLIYCACGCGQQREETDDRGRVRKFIQHHYAKTPTAKKAISNAHTGRKQSEEHIQKRKEAIKGIPLTEERKNKISQAHMGKIGDKSSRWKGGALKYRKQQVRIRDDYTCQICGFREPEIMIVDHIKPKCKYPELELEMNNLITLCPNCHARKTIREKKNKEYNKEE